MTIDRTSAGSHSSADVDLVVGIIGSAPIGYEVDGASGAIRIDGAPMGHLCNRRTIRGAAT